MNTELVWVSSDFESSFVKLLGHKTAANIPTSKVNCFGCHYADNLRASNRLILPSVEALLHPPEKIHYPVGNNSSESNVLADKRSGAWTTNTAGKLAPQFPLSAAGRACDVSEFSILPAMSWFEDQLE